MQVQGSFLLEPIKRRGVLSSPSNEENTCTIQVFEKKRQSKRGSCRWEASENTPARRPKYEPEKTAQTRKRSFLPKKRPGSPTSNFVRGERKNVEEKVTFVRKKKRRVLGLLL